MTTPQADPFAGSAGLPSISFAVKDQYGNLLSKPVGTRIGGTVLKAPSVQQSRNFTTKQPEFWPDGNAKTSVVVDLNVDCGGEGEMSLWVKKPSALFKAFQEAKGEQLVKPGDKDYVTLVGFGKPEEDKAPAKLYKVEYIPTDVFAAPTQAAATPAATTPASAPPAPPAPAAEPVLSNGFTASALLASGWSAAQIAALSAPAPTVVPQAPPVAPAPPAAVSAPSEALDAKAQRIAEMSPEDRALLNLG